MGLYSTPFIHAAGQVRGITGNLVGGKGAVSVRTGVGIYTLTLDQAIDETESSVQISTHGAATAGHTMVHTSDTILTINTFQGGIAADIDFDFLVIRHSP